MMKEIIIAFQPTTGKSFQMLCAVHTPVCGSAPGCGRARAGAGTREGRKARQREATKSTHLDMNWDLLHLSMSECPGGAHLSKKLFGGYVCRFLCSVNNHLLIPIWEINLLVS